MKMIQRELAELCNVTPRRIRQLVADGTITRGSDGKYSEKAITEFVRHIRRLHQDTSKFREMLDQEKYRTLKRENDAAEKQVAPVEVLEAALEKTVNVMIPPLEDLPVNLRQRLPELTDEQFEFVQEVVAECRSAMAESEIVLGDD